MVIIMLGAPASGKGSVAEILSNEFNIPAISSGDIFRKYISNGSEIGKKANEYEFEKQYDLFYFGRLLPEKNPLEFINIVAKIKEKHPNITAVMIGDGDLREECYSLIKELGLKDNIDLVGFKQNPFPIVKKCKVGIMPSKWEGFGLTAIESLVLGKPVLNSGVGGLKQIFSKNKEYICKSIDEYIQAYEKILEGKLTINPQMINEYTNKSEWKNNITKIYKK